MAEPNDPLITQARELAERAISYLDTIHLGPVDFNLFNAIDTLRTAAKILEDVRV